MKGEDSGSLDSDVANPRPPDHEPGTGVKSRKRNASCADDPDWVLGILKTFLVFLFGNNVTSRFGQAEAPSDGRDNDPSVPPLKWH